ncbi:P-loop containing nucleoside triphosphate hydrolase protein [Xylaria scruposa]|nr:P-loop containing nucleoside triphosphate hydrolase protein [Xylaria scruposa]
MRDNVIRLAVFGLTGAGKSSLVVHATGTPLEIGHGGDSCTEEVQPAQLRVGLKRVIFFDTPGFDDTQSRDPEIFEKISAWLAESRAHGKCLNGVILVQPVNNVRVPDSERQRTRLFKNIIGDQFYDRVAIVTTMWDKIDDSFGEQNERNRASDYSLWGDMLAKGAKVIRFQNDKPSALEVARHFANNASMSSPATMLLQYELEAYDGQLSNTSAAKQFEIDLGNKVTELEFSIKKVGGSRPKLEEQLKNLQTWRSRLRDTLMRIGNGMVETVGMAGNIFEIATSCASM